MEKCNLFANITSKHTVKLVEPIELSQSLLLILVFFVPPLIDSPNNTSQARTSLFLNLTDTYSIELF